MRTVATLCVMALLTVAAGALAQDAKTGQVKQDAADAGPVPAALNFTMKDIEGKDIKLSKYAGKVVLMVNVASKCGYTPQYEGLEALHEKYEKKGVAVLGFPANNFGRQEPGTDEEILDFCTSTYDVKFQMFSKVSVKGEDKCSLYKTLTDPKKVEASQGEIKWNFEKFLLDREGNVVRHYRSKDKPEDIAKDIEKLLAGETLPPVKKDDGEGKAES